MQKYIFCITYEKLYILNKKRRAFHEEAPTTNITTDIASSFFFFRIMTFSLLLLKCYMLRKGVIRIQKRCVEY